MGRQGAVRAYVCAGLALWVVGGSVSVALDSSGHLTNNPVALSHADTNASEKGTEELVKDLATTPLENNVTCPNDSHGEGVKLVSLRWREVGVYYTITAFVVIAGLAKLAFHHLHWLSSKVPESCVLVILGVALGLIVFFTTHDNTMQPCHYHVPLPHFDSDKFFFILLPPIVLESAYSLHDRAFFDNLGTVLVFAVVGTMFNIFTIGPILYGLEKVGAMGAMGNMIFSFSEGLVFSSLISAVDPVAVLAIFQELGVNKDLYFLVFGESLLNDGVTVVMYNTMRSFMSMSEVSAGQYALAVAAFLVVVFGGIFIGIMFGVLTALITRCTTDVRVVEPLALLGLAYLSYLTAELFHFSGIISLIVCGLIQAHYAFQNISQKSYTCVKYFTKMASATSDTVIFMFLGMVLVSDDHLWHTGFVLWTVLLCFVMRFIGVFVLMWVMNNYRVKKIGIKDQFIAAYGGLRGAVAFSLVNMLDDSLGPRRVFVTTTLVVILFTIFIQGTTIKPLVNLLDIQKSRSGKKNLSEEINDTTMDHIMAGVEEILGQHGDFYLREMMVHYNDKYFRKWLLRPSCETKLQRLFEKIAISEHFAHLYGPVAMIEDNVKPLCTTKGEKRVRTSSLSAAHTEEALLQPSLRLHRETLQDVEELPEKVIETGNVQLRNKRHSFIPIRQSRVSSEISQDESTSAQQTQDAQALRKAFRSNPYNKLHYKYNPNLVGEEDQELEEHLHRRHLNARRMTRLASSTRLPPPSHRLSDSHHTSVPEDVVGLVNRHLTRRATMSALHPHPPPLQTCFSSPDPHDHTAPFSPTILQALQEASEPPTASLPDLNHQRPPHTPASPSEPESSPLTADSGPHTADSIYGSRPRVFQFPAQQQQQRPPTAGNNQEQTEQNSDEENIPLTLYQPHHTGSGPHGSLV